MVVSTLWLLICLPHIIQAMTKLLPQPENVNLSSHNFVHLLTWESGPGSPRDLKYNVSFRTYSNRAWKLVPSCEHVEHPLVCNLTDALSDPEEEYFIRVTAVRGTQASERCYPNGFKPIKDTILDPPQLTVVPCEGSLCVGLNPPEEHLRKIYDSFSYKLRVQSSSGTGAELPTQHLKGETLKNLAAGKNYCVSVRIFDPLRLAKSKYSHPHCANTAAPYPIDSVIAVVVCVAILVLLVAGVLMVATGFIHIWHWWPLPPILTSIEHNEEKIAVLYDGPQCLPAYKKRSLGNSEEEEEEEMEEEAICGTDNKAYESRAPMNPHSSSSSSSTLPDNHANSHTQLFLYKTSVSESDCVLPHLELEPLTDHVLSESIHPETEPTQPRMSCLSFPSIHTQTSSDPELGLHFHRDTEESIEPEGNIDEVNLFSVTFGLHAEDPDVESFVAESPTAFSFEPRDREEVDVEAIGTSDSEEEEDISGYMRR